MKRVKDIMTEELALCAPDTPLQQVARMMVEYDCGCIPVVENRNGRKVVGVVTDRDICCRVVAQGRNPLQMTAGEVMSTPVRTVTADMSVDDCCEVMQENMVRRVPVVDEMGVCRGIVAQADLAMKAGQKKTAELIKEVSQPTQEASHVSV